MHETVIDRMKKIRAHRTYQQMKQSTHVSPSTWHRCEMGGRPSFNTLKLIALGEGVSLNWLVLGKGGRTL